MPNSSSRDEIKIDLSAATRHEALEHNLYQLFENIHQILGTSGTDQDINDILNDALPESMTSWIDDIIRTELEVLIIREVNEACPISVETLRRTAYNVFKVIKDSPELSNLSRNLENVFEKSVNSIIPRLNEKLNFRTRYVNLTQPKQIKHLARDLNNDSFHSKKIQNLHLLLNSQIPYASIILHECWPHIQENICVFLADENVELRTLSLQVHAKLISSPSFLVIKEGFISLLKSISTFPQNADLQNGFDLTNGKHKILAQVGHLILFTMKKLSLVVIKVNEHLEEMLKKFFELLSTSTSPGKISAYNIISALDPTSGWLQLLLHRVNIRNLTFSILSSSHFVNCITANIFMTEPSLPYLSFASITHSTNAFCLIIKFKSGQCLFPLKIKSNENPITIESVFIHVVNYMNNHGKTDIFQQLLDHSIPMPLIEQGILKSDSPLMRALLEPLPIYVPTHMANLIEAIAQTTIGVHCLLGAHDAKTLVDFTGMALQNHVKCEENVHLSLLRTCGKLFENHHGFVVLEFTPLIPKVVNQYKVLTSSENNSILQQTLFRLLQSICSTPLGLFAISLHCDLCEHLLKLCKGDQSEIASRCLAIAILLQAENQFDSSSVFKAKSIYIKRKENEWNMNLHQENCELSKFLLATRDMLHDCNWRSQLYKIYKTSTCQNISVQVLCELVDQLAGSKKSATTTVLSKCHKTNSNPILHQAINWTIRYGEEHNLLQPSVPQYADKLFEIHMLYHKSCKEHFDWFIAVSFLICAGNVEKCCSFLSKVACFPMAAILWPSVCQHNISRGMFAVGHKLELIIEEEVPVAAKVLKMRGICWWAICHRWIAQCFLNILEWEQICHWIALSIISQSQDGCIYFCASLLKHLENPILRANNDNNLADYLNKPIKEFKLNDQLIFINKLSKRNFNMNL